MTHDEPTGVADAIRATAADVHAPRRLHEAIDAQRPRRSARAPRVAAGVAACAAVAGALIVLAGGSSDRPPPTIADAAAVALLEPALPPPARDSGAPSYLRASAGGVRFPDYASGGLGWRADGLRRERRAGRDSSSCPRAPAGARAGYAIVAGAPLAVAAGARTVVRDRVRFAVLQSGGTTIVTWRRRGRTCVLASREASARALLAMAAWHPDEGSQERY